MSPIAGLSPELAAWVAEIEAAQAKARQPHTIAIVDASDTVRPWNELGHMPCRECGCLQGMPHRAQCSRRLVVKSWTGQDEPESDSQNSWRCAWCGNDRDGCRCGDRDSDILDY